MRALLCSIAAFVLFGAILALSFLAALLRTPALDPLGPEEP